MVLIMTYYLVCSTLKTKTWNKYKLAAFYHRHALIYALRMVEFLIGIRDKIQLMIMTIYNNSSRQYKNARTLNSI